MVRVGELRPRAGGVSRWDLGAEGRRRLPSLYNFPSLLQLSFLSLSVAPGGCVAELFLLYQDVDSEPSRPSTEAQVHTDRVLPVTPPASHV